MTRKTGLSLNRDPGEPARYFFRFVRSIAPYPPIMPTAIPIARIAAGFSDPTPNAAPNTRPNTRPVPTCAAPFGVLFSVLMTPILRSFRCVWIRRLGEFRGLKDEQMIPLKEELDD